MFTQKDSVCVPETGHREQELVPENTHTSKFILKNVAQ